MERSGLQLTVVPVKQSPVVENGRYSKLDRNRAEGDNAESREKLTVFHQK
jgi:hypothetical protein